MRLKIALAALAVLLSGIAAAPVGAMGRDSGAGRPGYRPPTGGVFNVPIGSAAQQTHIEDRIVEAINHARRGSKIHIALFSFDRRRVARALIRAHERRNVHVSVLLNDHQRTRAMIDMSHVFGHNRKRRSYLYRCVDGCRGNGEFLHSKMYLFSHTGRARNVVMTGSANLTTNAIIHQWNDLFIQRGNAALYDVFLKVFREMERDKVAHPVYQKFNIGKRYQLQALPFRNPSARHDPMMSVLDKIRCKGARNGTGIRGRTMLRVSMHRWAGVRGAYLARKVVQLYGRGCNVRVMHGSADDRVRAAIVRPSTRGQLPIRANGFDESGDGVIDRYSHQKYVVISGHFGKNRSEERIYTGSSNWSRRGVTGDELIFMARGHRLVRQWTANFDYLWRNGSRAITYGRGNPRLLHDEPRIGGKHWEND